jgi:uncharacterized membrane protein YphA (DoxX/SURF4 family)
MPLISQTIIQLSITVFLAILFLQSGLDKVFDWTGNLQFHTKHFANSPMNKYSKAMLLLITILEVTCGVLLVTGFFQLLLFEQKLLAFYGCTLSALIFIALFFGQRISKDYKGAAVLVPYFILAIMGIVFMS